MAPLVVIVGETASGKSTLALELAERFNGELICADSWTVRREVNVGTAKPSESDKARVPHHLLDVVEPCGDFTAAVFKRLANEAIAGIISRGKLPIMVGGTGLYIDGVIYDYEFLPEGDREARKALDSLNAYELVQLVQQRGISVEGIDTRNKRRLVRLLETDGARAGRGSLRTDTLMLGLRVDREELKQRVTRRTRGMLEQGLEGEVWRLAEQYGWECEALKGIGYREWQGYFAGTQTLKETEAKINKSTLELAKRQRTWFKRNESIHWLNNGEEASSLVERFLNKYNTP